MDREPMQTRKVAVTGGTSEKVGRLAAFADAWRLEAWPFERETDCLAFVSQHSDVAAVLVADHHLDACETLMAWRQRGLTTPVLVLLSDRRHGPADLARIIMAGADDAQHLDADPEEIAARLHRLTQRCADRRQPQIEAIRAVA